MSVGFYISEKISKWLSLFPFKGDQV